jgi:hypothetical protein
MKAKHIFALFGSANVGKSTTIRKVFALLTEAYPAAPVQTLNPPGVDITVIIEINGKFIGIESQGDPNSRLSVSIELFKKAKCSIIVCATRNWGGTVDTVEYLQPDFTIVWHHKKSEQQPNLQEQRNDEIAQIVFKAVQNALNA